jgi:16S rRNA (guanine527-N7)-methyltransferase
MITDPAITRLLEEFKTHLLEVNRKINLVSRQDTAKVVGTLVADSLAILELINYPHGAKVLDVGSGAGFPWIIHKIARQDLEIVSVDSNRRKIEFQRDSARRLGLTQCEFHAARIESIADIEADFCIAKALGSMKMICELTSRHLKASGILILPRSASEVVDNASIEGSGFVFVREIDYQASGRLARLYFLRKKA